MKSYKIIVTGPFNAGKTTLIRTLCEEYIDTDKRLLYKAIKPTTTVALDFGIIEIDGKYVKLFGTPGQERFSFMWRILSKGMDGYVLMIDSGDIESLEKAERIYEFFRKTSPKTPHIIAVNKYDRVGFKMTREDVRKALKVPFATPIRATVAISHRSALNLIRELLRLIEEGKIIAMEGRIDGNS